MIILLVKWLRLSQHIAGILHLAVLASVVLWLIERAPSLPEASRLVKDNV
jgi:hypothetical protein